MSKFKVGDRVRNIGYAYVGLGIGDTGTIVGVVKDSVARWDYAVQLDKGHSGFHNCGGKAKNDHGLYFYEKDLALIEGEQEFKLIITSKGDETTAKLIHGKEVAREVKVKRYHKDKYSEEMAIRAVVDKLFPSVMPKEQPKKYFTGKVVCIEDNPNHAWTLVPNFRKGCIYEINDGHLMGERSGGILDIVNVEDLNTRSERYKFIELKE